MSLMLRGFMDQQSVKVARPNVYGVGELLWELWQVRWVAVVVALICCAIGAAIGLLSTKEYTASVTVAPVLGNEGSQGLAAGLSSLGGQFGGLASLAGFSLPGKQENDEAIAVLQSHLLTREFVRENNLLPILYSNKWNPTLRAWKTSDVKEVPTLWTADRYFSKGIRTVTEDQKSGLYVLSIRWKNPQLAASWANGLVKMTNDYLRDQAIREAGRNIDYLSKEAQKATAVEVRQALYTLLENEIDKEMIARGREEYALKVIDPAFVPEKPSSLGALALGAIGLIAGALASIIFVFVRGVLRG